MMGKEARQDLMGQLTQREQAILQLLIKGNTNQEIAGALDITYSTAKNMVGSVLQKLGARHRTEAVIFGIRAIEREKNELIRKIVQVCASCSHFRGLGCYSVCNRKRSQCPNKRVKEWLDKLDELEAILTGGEDG